MERNEVKDQFEILFKEILENNEIVLTDSTTANEVEEWDSLTHIQIVVAIEKHFKIRFTSKEIQSWGTVGEMIDCVMQKISV